MTPFFSPRPWGGSRLARVLGKNVPAAGGPFGESWELSDHPNGRSAIANGPYAGRGFGELLRQFPREMAAAAVAPERFPLLIKYIDAGEDLSLQVHPNDAQAAAVGDRGKSECWLVMDCDAGTEIVYGLAEGTSAERLRQAAHSGAIEPCLRRIPIRPGDFLDVPAGTVHAILAGTLICEVQQSSDTTYRLWDWDRQPPRPLHIEASCAVAQYDPARTPPSFNVGDFAPGQWHRLVRNEFFEVLTSSWPAGRLVEMDVDNPHGLALNVVAGRGVLEAEGFDGATLVTGQTWFLPAGLESWAVAAVEGDLRLLLSETLELH
jgi:mannose-6-phosphate isomerase